MIEVVVGQPLEEHLSSAIFTPLGMVDSGFYMPPEKVERLAAVYESAAGALRRVDSPDANEITEHIPLVSSGTGCASTVPDYWRFARMLMRRGQLGGVRLLKPATVDEMTRNHLAAPLYPLRFGEYLSGGEGYGLGIGVIVEPSAASMAGSEGTYQWGGSWNTSFWVDPAKRLVGMFMSQSELFAFEGIGTEFRALVCQALID